MTLQPHQIRAALDHALAAVDLDATAPPHLGAPAAGVADLRSHRSEAARRRPFAVAAAVLVVAGLGLGVAVLASRSGPGRATDPALPPPVGPVVAAALDDPDLTLIDAADPIETPADTPKRTIPPAHIRIFRSPDGRTVAVADRSEDGDGSLDRFGIEGARDVGGVAVASGYNADLGSLDVSGWTSGPRRVRVATRGLTSSEHDAVVDGFVAASQTGALGDHVPDGFAEQYDGEDRNPFNRVSLGTEADYETDGGQRVSLLRTDLRVTAQELDRYSWYWTSNRPTAIGGRPALLAEHPEDRASLYLARPDGLVVVSGPADEVAGYADAVVPLDAAGWAAHKATAQAPGSIHQSAEATQPP